MVHRGKRGFPTLKKFKGILKFCSFLRCWVAGWGKDKKNGNFQPIQHKVDVPIYNRQRCESQLKEALRRQNKRGANRSGSS